MSNSNRVVVDVNLAALGVADLLEFSISLDDVSVGKPDPEPYLKALARMNISQHQAVAVEDSRTGVRSATSAGIAVFGLGGAELGAHWQVATLSQILELIARE